MTPGCTVAVRFSGSTDTIRSMRDRSMLIPPSTGMTWPSRLDPAPNGVTGTPSSSATASTRETSSVESG